MKTSLMISCRKATELTEKKLAGELHLIERIQLSIHRSLCSACKLYGQQAGLLDKWLRKDAQNNDKNRSGEFAQDTSSALEEKILKKLSNK